MMGAGGWRRECGSGEDFCFCYKMPVLALLNCNAPRCLSEEIQYHISSIIGQSFFIPKQFQKYTSSL